MHLRSVPLPGQQILLVVPHAIKTIFLPNKCVVPVKNHLRSCNLSRTKVTEYDLIFARESLIVRMNKWKKMVVCIAYTQAKSRYNYTGGHVKLSVSLSCRRIQEIREIFVTLVLVRSRKYFQLFFFNSCPLFLYQRTGCA